MTERQNRIYFILLGLIGYLWLLGTTSAIAAITVTGDSDPTYDSSDPWNMTGDLQMGQTSDTTFIINGGSDANITGGFNFGYTTDASITTTLTIDGIGSSLTIGGSSNIGGTSGGTWTIRNGATVTTSTLATGRDMGTDRTSPATTVNISGTGTSLTVNGNWDLGRVKTNTLNLSDGATITVTSDMRLHHWGSAIGTTNVTVTGTNSLIQVNDDWLGPGRGTGTVTVSDGGRILVNDDAQFANRNSSTTAELIVTGTNSLFSAGDQIQLGNSGSGTMTLLDGGKVSANRMTINHSNDTLRGHNGTLELTTTLTNNGVISPGASGTDIGTLNITGDVDMEDGSSLVINLTDTQADKLDLTGDYEIKTGSSLTVSPATTITTTRTHTILDATTITGTYSSSSTALLDLSVAEVSGPSLELTVTPVAFNSNTIVTNSNQKAVGDAFEQVKGSGAEAVLSELQGLSTIIAVRNAYDSLAGTTKLALTPMANTGSAAHAKAVSTRLHTTRGNIVGQGMHGSSVAFNRTNLNGHNNAAAASPVVASLDTSETQNPWELWIKGNLVLGQRHQTEHIESYKYQVSGFSLGLDNKITPHWRLGVSGGNSRSNLLESFQSSVADTDSLYGGVYSSYETDYWFLDTILHYTSHDFYTKRQVTFGTIDQTNEAKFSGYSYGLYLETGYDWWDTTTWLFQSLVGLYTHSTRINSYSETGTNSTALRYEAQNHDSIKSSLGGRLIHLINRDNGSQNELELRGRWLYELGDRSSSATAGLINGYVPFTVTDGEINPNSLLLGGGYRLNTPGKLSQVGIDGDFLINHDEQAFSLAVTCRFLF